MDNDACRAAPQRIRNEAMPIVALAFQRDENGAFFNLGGIRHDFSEARRLSLAQDLAARGRE